MSDKNDGGDKTEKPTEKKLQDARKKGDVAKSKDLTSAVAFDSSDTAVATVIDGLAAGTSVGTATITATDLASGIHGSTTLTVTAAVLVSIAVTPTQPSIALGTTQAFTATGVFSDSSTQDLTGSVLFDSSDTAIAGFSSLCG